MDPETRKNELDRIERRNETLKACKNPLAAERLLRKIPTLDANVLAEMHKDLSEALAKAPENVASWAARRRGGLLGKIPGTTAYLARYEEEGQRSIQTEAPGLIAAIEAVNPDLRRKSTVPE